jgi:predicted transcriptional regulator
MRRKIKKTAMVNARVSQRTKRLLLEAAEARGESEGMIIREALHEYFRRRELGQADARNIDGGLHRLTEHVKQFVS